MGRYLLNNTGKGSKWENSHTIFYSFALMMRGDLWQVFSYVSYELLISSFIKRVKTKSSIKELIIA